MDNNTIDNNLIPINKRTIGKCIALSIITLGIYLIYWEYLLVKNTRAMQKDDSSCTGEMICLVLVPFYNLYWWFTRGKTVNDEFSKLGYTAKGNEIAYLVLGIFGLDIVSAAIMQNDFNSLNAESAQLNERVSTFAVLHFILLLYSFVGVFMKLAFQNEMFSFNFFLFAGLAVLFLGIYAIIWQQVLKKMPLTVAFTNKAICIVWGMLWGALFLGDQITWYKILGSLIVFPGVVLVVSSNE